MTAIDEPRAEAGLPDPGQMFAAFGFLGTVTGDLAGALTSAMCAVGDHLGLFRAMADGAPVTAAALAARAGVDEVYTRDWLRAMSCSRYVDEVGGGYRLPPERAMVLAAEDGPLFMGGAFEQAVALLGPINELHDAFRTGAGVRPESYGPSMADGMERLSATWLDHQLVPQWLPALPAARDALLGGGRVADVGCGSGRALIRLAEAFPDSQFVGYDLVDAAVARATASVAAAGLAHRVTICRHDVTTGLSGPFDLITMFDVLHDIAHPEVVLAEVRRALAPGGVCVVVEANSTSDSGPERDLVGTILNATSVLYCIPTAKSWGAEGLGTMGLPEDALSALAADAGFSSIARAAVGDPFNAVYELRP